jgi:expansin (peptidoglycan-binding protein)
MRRLRVLLLGIVATVGLTAALPALAMAGSISGTVTAADTHGPLGGVEACAYLRSEGVEGSGGCDFTDSFGDYAIEGLVPAEYEVWFRANGTLYVGETYPGQVAVAAAPVTGIDAELAVGGRIEGTIRNTATGEPVAVSVCIAGISPGAFGGCTGSGSDGRYVLTVAAGEYRVEFEPFEGAFIAQYYDHSDHWWAATPVTVAVGETKTGIDADLGVGGRITGTVRLSGGAPVAQVRVCAWEATGLSSSGECGLTAADGTYALDRLPSAGYKVEFTPPAESGLMPEFWNDKAGWNEADAVAVSGEATVAGIDAYLDVKPPPTASSAASPTAIASSPQLPLRKCRKGFHRRLVKGKKRCVRKQQRHRHHRHHLGSER